MLWTCRKNGRREHSVGMQIEQCGPEKGGVETMEDMEGGGEEHNGEVRLEERDGKES